MLRRFLSRPKWQHRDPRMRAEGLVELASGDPRLTELARTDPDTGVRRQAVRRLMDPEVLHERFDSDTDSSVREAAHKRLCLLLAGEEPDGPGIDDRLKAVGEYGDEALFLYLLRHADAESLRQEALGRVDRPAVLVDVALTGGSGALRLAALERIDQPASLERVARDARGHDKRVARRARERLEQMRSAEARPRRQREICEAFEHLLTTGVPDILHFHRLQEEWGAEKEGAAPELEQRVAAAVSAFGELRAREQEAADCLARQHALCRRTESLASDLRRLKPAEPRDLGASFNAADMLESSWRALGEGPAINAGCASRFTKALNEVRTRLPELEAAGRILAGIEALVTRAEQMADAEAVPGRAAIQELEARWHATVEEHGSLLTARLRERFENARVRTRQRQQEASDNQRTLGAEFDSLLSDMGEALEAGELRRAVSFHDKAKDRLAKLAARGLRQAAREKRLRRAEGALRELRDWRSFGLVHVREDLIAGMQGLVGGDRSPTRLASDIRKLQDEWRRLDRASGPAAEPVWERFHGALLEARKPVDRYHEQQTVQHARNAAERSAFCDELSAEFGQIDWNEPDWPSIDRKVKAARLRWRKLGGVGPDRWRQLNGRFEETLSRVEERLAPERERERVRREGLISRVEALVGEQDLRRAVEEVKSAQAAWQPTVPVSRKTEQALWRRFRHAVDAVYARQHEDHEARQQVVKKQLAEREALCDALEALAVDENRSRGQARAELDRLRAAWSSLERLPPRYAGALERRFEEAVTACRRAELAAERRAAEEELAQWSARDELCESMENGLPGEGRADDTRHQDARAWAELPPLADEVLNAHFRERFERAAAALAGDADAKVAIEAAQDRNLTRRLELCLLLEITAGVESPPQFAEQRLALQVSRLSKAMTSHPESAQDQRSELREMLRQWYLAGPVPSDAQSALAERLERVKPKPAGRDAADGA